MVGSCLHLRVDRVNFSESATESCGLCTLVRLIGRSLMRRQHVWPCYEHIGKYHEVYDSTTLITITDVLGGRNMKQMRRRCASKVRREWTCKTVCTFDLSIDVDRITSIAKIRHHDFSRAPSTRSEIWNLVPLIGSIPDSVLP